jgi:hypothetical protein
MKQEDGSHVIWRFLRPEVEELVAYVTILAAMLGYALYNVTVRGAIGADSRDLLSSISSAKQSLLEFMSQSDDLGTLFIFGLWVLIGTVVYLLSWVLITILIDLSRDVEVASSFVHPRSFHQSDYWISVIVRGSIRLAGAAALIIYGSIWATSFAPVWIISFESLFAQGASPNNLLDAAAAIVGVGLTLHLGAILLRVALLRSTYTA